MLDAIWHTTTELAPWLLLGAAVAGVMHAWLPADFLRRNLAGRGGVARAVLLGVPLPLCSCGVIPTGLGLKKQGAGDGATVGFLISTPQTGVDSILVTAALLGLPFALFKVAWAAATGLVGGWVAEAVAAAQEPPPSPVVELPSSTGGRLAAATEHALDLIRSIWKWIVAGVLISAAISSFAPAEGLAGLAGYGGLLGMAMALVLSLPLYVCATASVPIAAALVAAGLPTGAAIVFLMAGPATNVATIGAVCRTLGGRLLAVYLTTIIVGSVAGGLLFGWLVASPAIAAPAMPTHTAPWWASASAIALVALFVWFLIDDLRRLLSNSKTASPNGVGSVTRVAVDGMTCRGCVTKLEKSLHADRRITAVRVTLEPGAAEVQGDVGKEELAQIIREAGFTPL